MAPLFMQGYALISDAAPAVSIVMILYGYDLPRPSRQVDLLV